MISGPRACAGSCSRRQRHSVRSRQSPGLPSGPQPVRTRRSTHLWTRSRRSCSTTRGCWRRRSSSSRHASTAAASVDVAGDTIVTTILVGNAIAVGVALGRWRGALIPYVPQLPVEYLAAATAATTWLDARRHSALSAPSTRGDRRGGDARADGRRGCDRGAPHPPRPMRTRRRRSLLYVVYLHSPLWRLRRRIWIVRAGGRCQRCGSRRRLTIHHRTYQRLGHERRADVTVLCWHCHRRHHNPPRGGPSGAAAARLGSDARAWPWRHGSPRVGRGSPGPSRTAGTDRGADTDRRRHAARKAMRPSPIPSRSPVGASGVDRLVALRADCAPAAARLASRSLRSLPLALRASVPLGRQAGAAGPRSTNRSPQGGNK